MALRLIKPHNQKDITAKLDFSIPGLCARLAFKYAACQAVGKSYDFANVNPQKTADKQRQYIAQYDAASRGGLFTEKIKVLRANISE